MGKINSIKRTYNKEDLDLLIDMLSTLPEEKKNDMNRWTWWAGIENMNRHTIPVIRRSDYAKSDLQRIVDSKRAHESGVRFYQGNQDVWLSDPVPPLYLSVYRT